VRICALPLLLLFCTFPHASAQSGKQGPSRAIMSGEMALQKGSPEQAIVIYEEALAKRPRSKKLVVALILAKVRLNQCEASRALLMPYRDTRVVNGQVLEGLAACFSRLGDYSEAVYWAEERVYLAPPSGKAYASLSSYRRGAGDRLGAIEALALAEQLNPHSESVLITKLQVAVGKGDVDRATLLLRQLDAIGESRSQMNWFLRAKLALDLGDFKGALEASDACLKIRFQFSPIRALRGEIFRRMGQLGSADASLNQIYDSAIGVVGLQAIQIRLMADLGLFAEAHELLGSVQLLSPLRPDVVASAWYLAQVEGHLQEAEQRRAMYELVQYNSNRVLENLLIFRDQRSGK
jgi:tetratricopeptide (TPR) repeat protein